MIQGSLLMENIVYVVWFGCHLNKCGSLASKAKEAMFFVLFSPINATATESEIIKWKASPAAKAVHLFYSKE